MSVIEEFINIAKKEVGYKEAVANITKYNEWADKNSVWFAKVQGSAWCATFVAWCIAELAKKFQLNNSDFYMDNKCCWSDRWQVLFRNNHRLFSEPKCGDLAFRNGHVGIVVDVDYRYKQVEIIEGNVRDSVNTEWYNFSQWVGFGRPNWTAIIRKPEENPEQATAEQFVINQGIYIGKDDGEMHWEDNLTREEMALILYRYWRKFNK